MKRITLVIPTLTSGGAERVMTTLANAWVDRGRTITLLSFNNESERPFYSLDPRIEYRPLSLAGASKGAVSAVIKNAVRIWKLRRAIG